MLKLKLIKEIPQHTLHMLHCECMVSCPVGLSLPSIDFIAKWHTTHTVSFRIFRSPSIHVSFLVKNSTQEIFREIATFSSKTLSFDIF